MRLFVLTSAVMLAFAGNSVLNRAALTDGVTGPAAFAALRMVSGALCLSVLVLGQRGLPTLGSRTRIYGAGSLAVYVIGFSFAYVALDAGVGALILFGVVQIVMFGGAVIANARPPAARWIGSAIAFAGLVWLLWPGNADPINPSAAGLMVLAGIGWGLYSLIGRAAADPLQETAANFIAASPLAVLVWLILPDTISVSSAWLAIMSGAVTSALGYALWYSVLPRLEAADAAIAQLTVPVIAVFGGAIFLSESVSMKLVMASFVILGGVAYGVLGQRTSGSSGS